MSSYANDSGLFRTAHQLPEAGAVRTGADWVLPDGAHMVPLCEAKMIHQFDHRWATYGADGESSRDVDVMQKGDPSFTTMPRYWVPEEEVDARLSERGWTREWLMGWRDICRATDERTVIAAVMPMRGVNHKLPLLFTSTPPQEQAALLGALSSLVVDFVARQKVGGTSMAIFHMRQLPIPGLEAFTPAVVIFLTPRLLELTYTAEDMRPWANDLGYDGPPFAWDEARRALLRAELDAAYAHLYGLTRDELRYILDPTDIHGPGFPSETFRVLKDKETRQHGEYRTARLVLAAWDRLMADGTFKEWTQ